MIKPLLYFITLGLIGSSGAVSAQFGTLAIEAAQNAGCITDYDGKLTTSERVHQVCDNGFPDMDSYVTRLCEDNSCATMRIRPFAKVSFSCSETVSSVSCI